MTEYPHLPNRQEIEGAKTKVIDTLYKFFVPATMAITHKEYQARYSTSKFQLRLFAVERPTHVGVIHHHAATLGA